MNGTMGTHGLNISSETHAEVLAVGFNPENISPPRYQSGMAMLLHLPNKSG
jgi:hypothetical protein